jgi:hypothetical protein
MKARNGLILTLFTEDEAQLKFKKQNQLHLKKRATKDNLTSHSNSCRSFWAANQSKTWSALTWISWFRVM